MRKLAAGVYEDGKTLHVFIPEMLTHYGLQDTPENRDICTEAAEKVMRELGWIAPSTQVNYNHRHRCPRCSKGWDHDGEQAKCIRPTFSICSTCSS